MRRYLFTWLIATAVLLLAVAVFNLLVDPYGLLRLVDKPGFNRVKPEAANRAAMAKAYQMLRVQPRTLVLGNSRAEVGLDPAHPAWPPAARPVYNAALPGSGTDVSLHYLRLALAAPEGASSPKVVVWGLDMMDFLTDAKLPHGSALPEDEPGPQPLPNLVARTGWPLKVQDLLSSTLTLAALQDSVHTLLSQHDPFAVDLTPLGFNPMRDYEKISAEEGYWNLFRQKDQVHMVSYSRRPQSLFDASGNTSPAWEDLRLGIRLCRERGINLVLFSYPYHAHLLEAIRLTGHWEAFETWKRTVVQILAEEARGAGRPAYAFWDFSAFNALSTEAVPPPGDRKSRMRWYWEAGHFKSALGGLMLERMLGQGSGPSDFGVVLNDGNLDAHIRAIQTQAAVYRRTHLQDMRELGELLQHAARR